MFEDKIKVKDTNDFSTTEGLLVSPYISDSYQRTLIGIYIQELFSKDNDTTTYNILNSENSLLLAEIDLLTNIQMVEEVNGKVTPLFTLNDVFKNITFINEKLKSISNYRDFMFRLASTIEMVKEERRLEKSLGNSIDTIYAKLLGLLEKFEDLNPESIKSLVEEVEKSTILKESIEIFKNQKGAKSPKKKSVKSEE